MCGIVGYTGPREAYPVILKGLKRLEYRGYDSAGVPLMNNGQLKVYKKKGKETELKETWEKTHMPILALVIPVGLHTVSPVTGMHTPINRKAVNWQ